MKRIFNWDGDKIRESVSEEDKKHSPKDILNGIAHVESEIAKMENSKIQLVQQAKTNDTNLDKAKQFKKDLEAFKEKCIELQKESMKLIIAQIKDNCIEKAKEEAAKEIAADPDAYTENQKNQLPYLKYQKLLATNEKMAEKISNTMIREYLYEHPIFDNPFQKD